MHDKRVVLLLAVAIAAALAGCAGAPKTEARPQKAPTTPAKAAPAAQKGVYYDASARKWRTWEGGTCGSCTPQNGFSTPVVMDGDMYYDPDIKKWRQSSMKGDVCHTCTPQFGYPIPPK